MSTPQLRPRVTWRSLSVGLGVLLLVAVVLWFAGRVTSPELVLVAPEASTSARSQAPPSQERDPQTGLRWADLASLPPQVAVTVRLIQRGGPFPYAKDGTTFRNNEQRLPRQSLGFYREYTVTTPGSSDRGARRVITGDDDRQFFYTGDHYGSFVRIRT